MPCDVLCLLEDVCGFNVGKGSGVECSNPIQVRPKRSGIKLKSGMPTLQGPPVSDFDGVITKKPTSKASISSSAVEKVKKSGVEEDGLKKGTWKRAHTKSRLGLHLPLNNLLGPKRSSREISREAKKAELAKKKTKVSNSEVLHVLSGIDQITSTEVATQPCLAL